MNSVYKKQLLLIDGSSYIYRAFHAIPHLSNSKGLPTNAVYGFIQMLLKVINDFKPDHVAVAFDVKGPSFRQKMYEQYKAHRPAMPDSLRPQIPYIKEVVRAFNIPVLEREGYEADDIIGTLSRHMKDKGIEVLIVASDKDMMQLVDDNTAIVDPMKDKRIGVKDVVERFAVMPERVVDIMALSGDASDNIPGVKGIGEKTAIKLIQRFGTVEEVLKNIDKIAEKRVRERLEEHQEDALLSKRLATIEVDVPVEYRFEDLAVSQPDYGRLKELLKELEFSKLVKEIIQEGASPVERDYARITVDDLRRVIAEAKEKGEIAIVIKREAPIFGKIKGLAISIKPHQAFYLHVKESLAQLSLNSHEKAADVSDMASAVAAVKPLIEDEGVKKISHDIKGVYTFFKQNNIEMMGENFDTGIASYLLNPSKSRQDIETVASEYLDLLLNFESETAGQCAEADAVFQLYGKLRSKLEEDGLLRLFYDIEIPLSSVLSEMELAGIKVDRDYLSSLSRELGAQIEDLKQRIYAIAGSEFNINSPKQLSHILFEIIKLKPVRRTKTGFSTDEEVLRTLAAQHELPIEILNFRQLSKLKSTYVDAILGLINPATQRVHTSFNQTVTATGRLSSSEPNLQNIPIRTELGKRIRKAFVAEKGNCLLSADYSQIELRIAAHLSKDPLLIEAFKGGEDIHAKTASEVFGIPMEHVTEEMRRRAKAINFGIIYGMGPYGLSAELGISQEEAQAYIDNYFLHYKGVKLFIDQTIHDAMERGYVTTIFGRRRHIPELRSESDQIRRFGERIAINTPVQGTAADMIKIAMIHINGRLQKEKLGSKMLLQIHDELILESPENEIDALRELVRKEMETACTLSVPVRVDIQTGGNWGEIG